MTNDDVRGIIDGAIDALVKGGATYNNACAFLMIGAVVRMPEAMARHTWRTLTTNNPDDLLDDDDGDDAA